MADTAAIIRAAAQRGHEVVCVHGMQCPGPSEMEVVTAATVVNYAVRTLFRQVEDDVTAVLVALQNGHGEPGGPDATSRPPEDLLRAWFHWWRTQEHEPPVPAGLHIQTVAYLATRAVEDGRVLHGPADV